ncbi:PQ loop repeat-domain-containing protein [Yarrowia lipolytica]|uniref:PQ loop repeat-domain-containing protein n=1 Tax=Yarrowia lipolytica TaxID=4952 RepID=A0A1D8NBA2_YARLL|nr:hypothetical protein YALI1_C21664g [Yarrowia lipolytica]KAB8280422.1 PQ loop repeat-domain-containing protein [Yarrowia lipolytica]KAE8169511.1 PQ loop repeat-domain-containing protein [Yarrowia lipolytica]RDW26088.1 PQ loop repeat-domain-containing protein [Yarrowia lipolytica]RDW39428.1 PQ loop repeat-domain-containing protein [Yarrowia lipolytica]
MQFLVIVSSVLGWTYFALWSFSFYPPILLNIKLKSVEGISLDFLYLNTLGYICYTISTVLLYYNHTIREQYAARHSDPSGVKHYPLVRLNDVWFGIHGCFLTLLTLSQVYFWGFSRSPLQRLSKWGLSLLIFGIGISLGTALLVYLFGNSDPSIGLQWLDVTYVTGSVKVLMSTSKYFPQLLWNFRRKSTKGWSIVSILCDFGGGILSLAQLILDGYINHDYEGIFKNVPKLLLSLITLIFDIMFMLQHYVWYNDSNFQVSPGGIESQNHHYHNQHHRHHHHHHHHREHSNHHRPSSQRLGYGSVSEDSEEEPSRLMLA